MLDHPVHFVVPICLLLVVIINDIYVHLLYKLLNAGTVRLTDTIGTGN